MSIKNLIGKFLLLLMKIAAITKQFIGNVFSTASDCNDKKQLNFEIDKSQYSKTSTKKLANMGRSIRRKQIYLKSYCYYLIQFPGIESKSGYVSKLMVRRRRHRLKGIYSRSDTSRTGAESLSFYYPRLLHCLNQTLAVVSLSQHRVSSSKTVRPRAPCGARCIGHAVSTWSAVCSEASHSQFGEGARPHLCMDEWNWRRW